MKSATYLADLERRWPEEWVLILDPEYDDREQLVSGRVAAHNRDRAAVWAKGAELRPGSAAILYLGRIPAGSHYILSCASV
ncbi:MAG: hypothetical protein HY875_12420 [Chloroflexi bacterium]|nr:hypothetical protein [Chloroflexota bacterium]